MLLCAASPAAARRRRASNGNNSIDLNNPANINSASYHSLYNGPGNGNGGDNSNAGGNGNGQANGLDGDPNIPRGLSGHARPGGGGGSGSNGITYWGGPVMTKAAVTAYIIWYGNNWPAGHPALTVIPDFLQILGASAWWRMSNTYYDGANANVLPAVNFGGSVTLATSKTTLSDADVFNLVASTITSGKHPADLNGVYFLLTSKDVAQGSVRSNFCGSYCGWHTHGSVAGVGNIKYSWVGDSERCPAACAAQALGPNGVQAYPAGTDGMISVIAHELTEAATDPQLNAWYDTRGYENADKCAWTFGTQYTASNAAGTYSYNMQLQSTAGGTRQYLVQRNWVNAAGGYCSMQ
ncbi:hypothetical protein OEZ85_006417 [Tetradesmus obliquus]|uniref:Phosphate-induced protein 1 n=1 Tax=Tetradesmus obliquus TaxID=3088 RepID=A0ABY8TWZ4_TETOB|nr:hypothetical protein OEZ85_006417 [Tetradesmus obliquus]